MSTLLILLPPSPSEGQDYDHWFSADAQAPAHGHGARAPLSALPRADRVIALIADDQVSWLPVRLPPDVKGARVRPALVGMLEEQLLEDPDRLHLALMPRHADDPADAPQWVAVMPREFLRLHLQAFELAGLSVEALSPMSWPQGKARGHVFQGSDGRARLRASHPDGVATLPLDSSGLKTWLGDDWLTNARVTASPAASPDAESCLGRRVKVLSDTERAWASRQAPINLLQFDFTPRQRGWQRAYRVWQTLQTPPWRPFRWGVVGLLAVQVIGLNAMAWQQRSAVESRKEQQVQVLRQSFPQIRVVRDAPAQMLRETDLLRGSAGQPGPGDLEDLLSAVARAWPQDHAPLSGLRFEPNRLQLTGVAPPMRAQLRERLSQEATLAVADEGDTLTISLRPTR